MDRNYVGAVFDYSSEKIMAWERPIDGGERVMTKYDAPFYFYVPDTNGEFTSIFKDKLKKLEFDSYQEFANARNKYSRKFESDIQPLFKFLMRQYHDVKPPKIHYALFDIEVYYEKIFATVENPYGYISAVSIYQSWTNQFHVVAIPPKDWNGYDSFDADMQTAAAANNVDTNCIYTLVKSEKELLLKFIELIGDSDFISGWNTEFFDIPYIVKRLEHVFGPKGPAKLCFRGAKPPKLDLKVKYGKEHETYQISGRTHTDYLDMFKKFIPGSRISWKLESIAEEELDIPKLSYEKTLEHLYNNEFHKFLLYSYRDTQILERLENKFKFVQTVNQMAHENCCLFQNIMGTVKYVETGITLRTHYVHNLIVPDKRPIGEKNEKVEGAVVLTPNAGLHKWIGSIDIKSLYPSCIRLLNMSPETFVAQFAEEDKAWLEIYQRSENLLTLVFDDGRRIEASANEWRELLEHNHWAVSGFGTVFDQGSLGVVADTIAFWYSERERLQAEKKKWGKVVERLQKEGAAPAEILAAEKEVEHYDLLQYTKKIQLNSLYGALLNEAFTFNRRELGASVTATGRQITTHMTQTVAKHLSGEDFKLRKTTVRDDNGEVSHEYSMELKSGLIYSDTDSAYFKTFTDNIEDAVKAADTVASVVNDSFPAFVQEAFNATDERSTVIKCAREIVGESALFFKVKKKYTIKVVDNEGKRCNKLKSMGSEIKRSDTPKIIQDFLKKLMNKILDGDSYQDVAKFVNQQRKQLIFDNVNDLMALGATKQINKFEHYLQAFQSKQKMMIPGHVRAAINFHLLSQEYDENPTIISSGDKMTVFYLKNTNSAYLRNMKTIAFPSDTEHVPEWFLENFTVDMKMTSEKMVDSKIEGIFDALGQPIPSEKQAVIQSAFIM
jgi:DNA polymerase elongation subunit (family B)